MRLQSVLRKTIVFITHDFDEAIRLADRIAIMKDGEIVQLGTPEEIVLAPATDYVAEFTRNVAKAQVVTVRSIMRPGDRSAGDTSLSDGAIVAVTARVAEAAPLFGDGVESLDVVTDDGETVGRLARADVVDLMMRG